MDSWGRRPLLLTGVAGMVASLCLLSATTLGYTGASPNHLHAPSGLDRPCLFTLLEELEFWWHR